MAKSKKKKGNKSSKGVQKKDSSTKFNLPKWLPLTIGGLALLIISNLLIGAGSYFLTKRKYKDADCKQDQEVDCESDSDEDKIDPDTKLYPTEEEVKAKVNEYINNELLGGQSEAEIKDFKIDPENENLYTFKVVLDGQSFDSYASIDGKYIYTERIDMTESQDSPDTDPDQDQPTPPDTDNDSYPQSDTPEVLLFTMSYCPYGNQAEDFVQPVYELLKNDINFEPHYVIYSEDYGYEGSDYCLDKENQYCSMHGIQELNQGIRELCTYKYQKDKFWDFVAQANSDCTYNNVDTCWKEAASKVELNSSQISTCESSEAIELLKNEVALNEKHQVTGSPTILINGKNYSGSRTPEDFKKAICSSFETKPAACDTTLESSSQEVSGSCN